MSLTREIAKYALSLDYSDIPEPVRHQARRFMLDSIGCALAAVENEDIRAAQRYVEKLGGVAEATVFASGLRCNAPCAALMNALLIRALDYNDIYWKQDPSHPSDLIPAALAAGEKAHCSTRELITAVVIAYELEMRWCLAAEPGIREIGWHHASLTQLVSPFLACRMLGLGEDQTVAAAGISGSSHFTLGGVVAGHLSQMKNSADPFAVEAGVRAALLASENYTGPEQVIEGKEGVFEVLNSVKWSAEKLLDGLGEHYLIHECGLKAYPTEALTHQPITAALNLRSKYRLSPEKIASVRVHTTRRGADILSDPPKFDPRTRETADHSLPYCIAAALADGAVLPSSFSEDKLFDPVIRDLLTRIDVVADAGIDDLFPRIKRAVVEIETRAGEKLVELVDHAKGSPENPMSDDEVIEKFRANAGAVLERPAQQELVEATFSLGDRNLLISDYMKMTCRR